MEHVSVATGAHSVSANCCCLSACLVIASVQTSSTFPDFIDQEVFLLLLLACSISVSVDDHQVPTFLQAVNCSQLGPQGL